MKILYLDCFSGISGDMTIGALLDAGGDFTYLQSELEKLHINEEYDLSVEKVVKNGITSTKFNVLLKNDSENQGHSHDHDHTHHHVHSHHDHSYSHTHHHSHDHEHSHTHEHSHLHDHGHSHTHEHSHSHDHGHSHTHEHSHSHDHGHTHTHEHNHNHSHDHAHAHNHSHSHDYGHHHHHRAYRDIVKLISESELSGRVKETSLNIFKVIGEAEGKIHGMPLDEVHFHEVGAVDSIIDIVGTAILLEQLEVDEIKVSAIPTGSGKIHIDHGIYPVPAPATLEILREAPIAASDIKGELTTPTGAGIVKALAKEFCAFPAMKVKSIGYGAGTKTFPNQPNVLRVVIGEF